jgi:hypothetical protein
MRRRALVTCVVAVVGLTGSGSGHASAPVSLAGRTTIAAPAGAGQLRVRIPRAINLPGTCDNSTGVSVRGTAAFVAVVLAHTPYRPGIPNVVLGKLPDGRGFDTVCGLGQRPIEPGDYTLTVVHSPGTAVLSLNLPGLAGRLSLDRFRSVRATAAILPKVAAAPADVSKTAGGWGADGQLSGQGMTATFMWLKGTVDAAVFGTCGYSPGSVSGAVPAQARYAPGCPVGENAMSWAVRSTGVYFNSSTLGIDAGTYGLGAWYAAPAGAVVTGGAASLWVPFG